MGLNFPHGFKELVLEQIDDWQAFETAHQQNSPASIRLNPKKKLSDPDLPTVPWCENGFYLPERPHYTMDPLFHAGVYYPQESGSMLLSPILRQLPLEKENLRVLDLCAAPGGKSTIVLDWLDDEGFLVSNEVISKRARVLQDNLDKWGRANRLVSNSDPAQFAKLGSLFDVVVVDAPCSGEGMFRKEPDALSMWSVDVVEQCHQRQCGIVEHAITCLKPGGFLIYSTCTFNQRENEDVLQYLAESTGAESIKLEIPSEWNISTSEKKGFFGYRCFPHRTKSEGFFISVLQKPGETIFGKRKPKSSKKVVADKKLNQILAKWIHRIEDFAVLEHRGNLYFLPKSAFEFVQDLTKSIHVLSVGQQAGRNIRDELVPGGAMALSTDLKQDVVPKLEMNAEEAIAYLSKSTFPVSGAPDGLFLCSYRDVPCGWAKVVAGKLKNQWPKEWRIRYPQSTVTKVV